MSDIGFYALRIALVTSIAGIATGIFAGLTKKDAWTRVAERAVLATYALVSLAMLALFWAFATFDFQLEFVAGHAARSMSLPYRLAALWGGQAGSLLLWVFMLLTYSSGVVLANRRTNREFMPWVSGVITLNAAFFLVIINFLTNPFTKLAPELVLSDGAGLNPLLQHPAMLVHPLFLYAGLTGFVVPFSFGFAALATGKLGNTWLRSTRRWTLIAWLFLSCGIIMGGRWAYEVLGWGGYWAWDPVENASFMPWIAASAYLHSVMIQEKRDMLKVWNMVLVGLTYSLCLMGTFLTRSGIVQSVHAFAQSSMFGIIFGGYVLTIAAVFYTALLARLKDLRSERKLESVVSRESSFLLNNWAFMGLLAIVIWGTLFPVVSEAVIDKKIAVGPGFFNTLSQPVAILLLALTGIGPLIAWRKASPSHLRRQFTWPVLAGLVVGICALAISKGRLELFTLSVWSLSAFVFGAILQEYARAIRSRRKRTKQSVLAALLGLLRQNPARYGGYVVHLGIVFMLMGFSGTAFNQERLENVQVGEQIQLGGYSLRYLTADVIPAKHHGGAKARFALSRNGKGLATMIPEKRLYWVEQQPASVPSIYSTLREDFYITLNEIEPDGSATVKIHINPLVSLIWVGGYTLLLGTVIILWPHPVRTTEQPA